MSSSCDVPLGLGDLSVTKVYDVTKFLDDHPGGDEVLISATGKDATDDFEDVGHSSSARAMLDEYYVGDIDSASIPTNTKYTPPKQPHYNQDKTSEFVIKLLQFLVPKQSTTLNIGGGLCYLSKSWLNYGDSKKLCCTDEPPQTSYGLL